MSLQEKLIKSAKAGNSREVRKLLGRGVQITKDKVDRYACISISGLENRYYGTLISQEPYIPYSIFS